MDSAISESIKRFRNAAPRPRNERGGTELPAQWWREGSPQASATHPQALQPMGSFAFQDPGPAPALGPASLQGSGTRPSSSLHRYSGSRDAPHLSLSLEQERIRAAPMAARWPLGSDYRSSGEDFTVHEDQSIPLAVSESNLGARSTAYSYLSSVAASRIGEPSSARTGPGQGSGHKLDIMGPGFALDSPRETSRLAARPGPAASQPGPALDVSELRAAGFSSSAVDALRRLSQRNPVLLQALLNIERGPDGHISARTVERVRTALGEIRGAASFRGSPTGWSGGTGMGGQRAGGNDTSAVSSAPASAKASLDTLVISADVRGSVAMGGVQAPAPTPIFHSVVSDFEPLATEEGPLRPLHEHRPPNVNSGTSLATDYYTMTYESFDASKSTMGPGHPAPVGPSTVAATAISDISHLSGSSRAAGTTADVSQMDRMLHLLDAASVRAAGGAPTGHSTQCSAAASALPAKPGTTVGPVQPPAVDDAARPGSMEPGARVASASALEASKVSNDGAAPEGALFRTHSPRLRPLRPTPGELSSAPADPSRASVALARAGADPIPSVLELISGGNTSLVPDPTPPATAASEGGNIAAVVGKPAPIPAESSAGPSMSTLLDTSSLSDVSPCSQPSAPLATGPAVTSKPGPQPATSMLSDSDDSGMDSFVRNKVLRRPSQAQINAAIARVAPGDVSTTSVAPRPHPEAIRALRSSTDRLAEKARVPSSQTHADRTFRDSLRSSGESSSASRPQFVAGPGAARGRSASRGRAAPSVATAAIGARPIGPAAEVPAAAGFDDSSDEDWSAYLKKVRRPQPEKRKEAAPTMHTEVPSGPGPGGPDAPSAGEVRVRLGDGAEVLVRIGTHSQRPSGGGDLVQVASGTATPAIVPDNQQKANAIATISAGGMAHEPPGPTPPGSSPSLGSEAPPSASAPNHPLPLHPPIPQPPAAPAPSDKPVSVPAGAASVKPELESAPPPPAPPSGSDMESLLAQLSDAARATLVLGGEAEAAARGTRLGGGPPSQTGAQAGAGGGRRSRSVLKEIRERYELDRREEADEKVKDLERAHLKHMTFSDLVDFLHSPDSPIKKGHSKSREGKRWPAVPSKEAAALAASKAVARSRLQEDGAELDLSGLLAKRSYELLSQAMKEKDPVAALTAKVGGTAALAVTELHKLAEVLERANLEKSRLLAGEAPYEPGAGQPTASADMDASSGPDAASGIRSPPRDRPLLRHVESSSDGEDGRLNALRKSRGRLAVAGGVSGPHENVRASADDVRVSFARHDAATRPRPISAPRVLPRVTNAKAHGGVKDSATSGRAASTTRVRPDAPGRKPPAQEPKATTASGRGLSSRASKLPAEEASERERTQRQSRQVAPPASLRSSRAGPLQPILSASSPLRPPRTTAIQRASPPASERIRAAEHREREYFALEESRAAVISARASLADRIESSLQGLMPAAGPRSQPGTGGQGAWAPQGPRVDESLSTVVQGIMHELDTALQPLLSASDPSATAKMRATTEASLQLLAKEEIARRVMDERIINKSTATQTSTKYGGFMDFVVPSGYVPGASGPGTSMPVYGTPLSAPLQMRTPYPDVPAVGAQQPPPYFTATGLPFFTPQLAGPLPARPLFDSSSTRGPPDLIPRSPPPWPAPPIAPAAPETKRAQLPRPLDHYYTYTADPVSHGPGASAPRGRPWLGYDSSGGHDGRDPASAATYSGSSATYYNSAGAGTGGLATRTTELQTQASSRPDPLSEYRSLHQAPGLGIEYPPRQGSAGSFNVSSYQENQPQPHQWWHAHGIHAMQQQQDVRGYESERNHGGGGLYSTYAGSDGRMPPVSQVPPDGNYGLLYRYPLEQAQRYLAGAELLNPRIAGKLQVEKALTDARAQVDSVYGSRPPDGAASLLRDLLQ